VDVEGRALPPAPSASTSRAPASSPAAPCARSSPRTSTGDGRPRRAGLRRGRRDPPAPPGEAGRSGLRGAGRPGRAAPGGRLPGRRSVAGEPRRGLLAGLLHLRCPEQPVETARWVLSRGAVPRLLLEVGSTAPLAVEATSTDVDEDGHPDLQLTATLGPRSATLSWRDRPRRPRPGSRGARGVPVHRRPRRPPAAPAKPGPGGGALRVGPGAPGRPVRRERPRPAPRGPVGRPRLRDVQAAGERGPPASGACPDRRLLEALALRERFDPDSG
jgi:hypothetical protein